MDPDARFAALQERLRTVHWPRGDGHRRTVVILPSLNFDRRIMEAHAELIALFEERSLWWLLALREPWVDAVVILRRHPERAVLEYYLSLLPDPESARARIRIVVLGDESPRALALVLLERPEALDAVRAALGEDASGAMLLPYNVGAAERDVALALGVPVYAVDHRFAIYGRKSAGRRLFAQLGIPISPGVQDVRTADDVARAIMRLDAPAGVVVKLDDGLYGDGNLRLPPGAGPEQLPDVYLAHLERGGVVEAWVDAAEVRSPSVQLRILPGEGPVVISTHDQLLGGDNGQQFAGCRFPADLDGCAEIVDHARAVGEHLAGRGMVGRFGIDFVVARDPGASWRAYAMELNLREGGTSHPYGTLWLLAAGDFDPAANAFLAADGTPRCYLASDEVPVAARSAQALLERVGRERLGWDPATATGTVLHMFPAVERLGRIAAVTVGTSHEDAAARHERFMAAVR